MEEFRIGDVLKESVEFETVQPAPQGGMGEAFGQMVEKILHQTNQAQIDAEQKAEQFAKGEVGLVDTVLAVNKADTSLRLLLEVRNKALEAYREITRAR